MEVGAVKNDETSKKASEEQAKKPPKRPKLTQGVTDKKLRRKLKKFEAQKREALQNARKAEILLPSDPGYLQAEGMEKTYKFTQNQILEEVDIRSASKIFSLDLTTFGPYSIDYTRNGRFLAIAGRKGHVGLLDWIDKKLLTELHLRETVRDIKFLSNETRFAVAQKKYVYMYDKNGVEITPFKHHIDVNKLEYLPYHWLLVSVGNAGYLKYQDISTGALVAELRTKLGPCDCMRSNPQNAIINLGHSNGTVTMWTPNISGPVVKMLCHSGPVRSIAFDGSGNYMVTVGLDGKLKVWDVRTYKKVHSYYCIPPASTIDVSQLGVLAVGHKGQVKIWKDAITKKQKSPYMVHKLPGEEIKDVLFCPYDDVLGIGHSKGFASILVPGSGEPNFDTFEENPFQSKKQRQEAEVKKLLEKIPADMITLTPDFVGNIDRAPAEVIEAERKLEYEANHPTKEYVKKAKNSKTAIRRLKKKQQNIWDEKRALLVEAREKRKRELEEQEKERLGIAEPPSVLDRFKRSKTSSA